MANVLVEMAIPVRLEAASGFGSGTNTAYALKFESRDRVKNFYLIWGSGAPSTDYDTAPAGSIYIDFTNAEGYVKKATTGWTQMT